MITKKEQIIEYFKSGIKNKKEFKIGIEHEKFLFNSQNNKRIDYQKIKEMFSTLLEFGWNPANGSTGETPGIIWNPNSSDNARSRQWTSDAYVWEIVYS